MNKNKFRKQKWYNSAVAILIGVVGYVILTNLGAITGSDVGSNSAGSSASETSGDSVSAGASVSAAGAAVSAGSGDGCAVCEPQPVSIISAAAAANKRSLCFILRLLLVNQISRNAFAFSENIFL